ncbi:MAG: 4-hydroxy-tetrahydrodipicolinate reductase [Solobacterium sp.]|nr:4-hydroxy-tetrahydrodipicolinate reductase [Solobacterium sp.]
MKILIGGKGRMGSLIASTAEAAGHTVLGMADAFDKSALEGEAADVVIDFSHRDNLSWIKDYVLANHCALVYGTTGVTEEDKAVLNELAKTVPVFYSSNFSYGVAVLRKLIATAVPLLKDTFDMELVETHHNQKKDAPSGTAKALLEIMNPDGEFKEVYGREGITGARGKEIGVHALRGGTEAGEHSVFFFGDNERITVSHHAANRQIFVNGAIRAAQYLEGKGAGMYNMDDLLLMGGNE